MNKIALPNMPMTEELLQKNRHIADEFLVGFN
jgi:hypothetical protein